MADLSGGGFGSGNQLSAEAGYGLAVGRRLVGTPTLGIGASAYGRDYRLGYKLSVLRSEVLKFELGVTAQRRDLPDPGKTSHGALGQVRATVGRQQTRIGASEGPCLTKTGGAAAALVQGSCQRQPGFEQ